MTFQEVLQLIPVIVDTNLMTQVIRDCAKMDNGLEWNLSAGVSKVPVCVYTHYNHIPLYVGIECDLPDYPTNGKVALSETTFMNNATYSCSDGYKLNGSAVRMCNATGHWVPDKPACDRKCI